MLIVVQVGIRRVLGEVLVQRSTKRLWAVVAGVHWYGGWSKCAGKNDPTAAIVYPC